MTRPKRRTRATPLAEFLQVMWRIPVVSLPFAAFFLMVNHQPWSAFPVYWLVATMFAAPIGLTNWGLAAFLAPAMVQRFGGGMRTTWWISGAHFVGSLFASVLSIVLLGLTLIPSFLTHGRSLVVALLYSTLFAVLFLGVALAVKFYREAVAHAGSERELQLARRIQRSFLLTDFPRRPRFDVHAVNLSSKEVSGDFYDVVQATEHSLLLAVADVSGKGVPAALLTSMIQASLRTQAGGTSSPAAMASIINTLACQRDSTGQFATLFLAVVDEAAMTLTFTNAGHNFPVLVRADGSRALLETGGLLAGMIPGAPYQQETLALAPGDRLVVYTDGVTEAANEAGAMYGEERLDALLATLPSANGAKQDVDAILDSVSAFLGEMEAGDDITVLVLRVREEDAVVVRAPSADAAGAARAGRPS